MLQVGGQLPILFHCADLFPVKPMIHPVATVNATPLERSRPRGGRYA